MNYENFTTGYNKPTIITGQQYGTKVSVELDHSDTDLNELVDAFHTLVIGMGYSENSWRQSIMDRADEYKEEEVEGYVNTLSVKDIDEALAEHNQIEEQDDDYNHLRHSSDNFEHYQNKNEEMDL